MYGIRDAWPQDVPGMQAIETALGWPAHPAEVLERAIVEGKVAVAEDPQEGVVGYARWEHFWDVIPLCLTVCVKPEHQRRGIGRRLFERIEEGLRRRGCAFWLSSTEETNDRSRQFHESLGFRRIGALAELGQDVAEVFYRKDIC